LGFGQLVDKVILVEFPATLEDVCGIEGFATFGFGDPGGFRGGIGGRLLGTFGFGDSLACSRAFRWVQS
jgi:hypothetical protein